MKVSKKYNDYIEGKKNAEIAKATREITEKWDSLVVKYLAPWVMELVLKDKDLNDWEPVRLLSKEDKSRLIPHPSSPYSDGTLVEPYTVSKVIVLRTGDVFEGEFSVADVKPEWLMDYGALPLSGKIEVEVVNDITGVEAELRLNEAKDGLDTYILLDSYYANPRNLPSNNVYPLVRLLDHSIANQGIVVDDDFLSTITDVLIKHYEDIIENGSKR